MNKLVVINLISSPYAISPEDGDVLIRLIENRLLGNEEVVVSFAKIKMLSVAFADSTIGCLYRKYNKRYLEKHLKIVDTSDAEDVIIRRVTERVKTHLESQDIVDLEE